MFSKIWGYVKRFWTSIKKFFVAVCELFNHLVSFFKSPARMQKLQSDKSNLAVIVKLNFKQEDYVELNCLGIDPEQKMFVSCIYNTEMKEVNNDVEVVQCEELDEKTKSRFNGKNMLVLN